MKQLSAGPSKEATVVVDVKDATNSVLKYSKSSQKLIAVCVRAGGGGEHILTPAGEAGWALEGTHCNLALKKLGWSPKCG